MIVQILDNFSARRDFVGTALRQVRVFSRIDVQVLVLVWDVLLDFRQ